MSMHDDELDRLLDGLGIGEESETGEIDQPTVSMLRSLFSDSARVKPDAAFVGQLEGKLSMGMSRARSTALRFVSVPALAPERSKKQASWFVRVGAVAAILIAMFAAVAKVDHNGSVGETPVSAIAAASPTYYPPASDCIFSEADLATATAEDLISKPSPFYMTALSLQRPMPNLPSKSTFVLPESVLPGRSDPDPSTAAQIRAAVNREFACRNAGVGKWPYYLGVAGILPASSPTVSGTPTYGDITPIPTPAVVYMSLQYDGSVFTLLSSDWYGYGVKMFLVFTKYGSSWLKTDWGLVASDAWIAQRYTGPTTTTVAIDLNGTLGWPRESRVPANTTVNLSITNHLATKQTVLISTLNLKITVDPGQTIITPFKAAPNGYLIAVGPNTESATARIGYIWAVDPSVNPSTIKP